MRNLLLLCAILALGCGSSEKSPVESTKDSITSIDTMVEVHYPLTDKSISFAWRQNVYNSQILDSINTIFIDTSFCKIASDEERAALGLVTTFIGSECYWEGGASDDQGNLKCKMNEWLRLGYQCSDNHLGFLRKWFKNDAASLSKLKDCPLIPHTATQQTTFDEIKLTVKDHTIKVWFRANGMNMQTNDSWYWTQEDVFEVKEGSLILIKSQVLKEHKEKFAA